MSETFDLRQAQKHFDLAAKDFLDCQDPKKSNPEKKPLTAEEKTVKLRNARIQFHNAINAASPVIAELSHAPPTLVHKKNSSLHNKTGDRLNQLRLLLIYCRAHCNLSRLAIDIKNWQRARTLARLIIRLLSRSSNVVAEEEKKNHLNLTPLSFPFESPSEDETPEVKELRDSFCEVLNRARFRLAVALTHNGLLQTHVEEAKELLDAIPSDRKSRDSQIQLLIRQIQPLLISSRKQEKRVYTKMMSSASSDDQPSSAASNEKSECTSEKQ